MEAKTKGGVPRRTPAQIAELKSKAIEYINQMDEESELILVLTTPNGELHEGKEVSGMVVMVAATTPVCVKACQEISRGIKMPLTMMAMFEAITGGQENISREQQEDFLKEKSNDDGQSEGN